MVCAGKSEEKASLCHNVVFLPELYNILHLKHLKHHEMVFLFLVTLNVL